MTSALDRAGELPDGYQLIDLVTPTFEEEEPDRVFSPVDEATVAVLRRETRIGLARGTVSSVDPGDPAFAGHDIPLMCVVQTHPECSVSWSRLVLDLSPTPDAVIADMSPSLVEGTSPIEIETTLGAGFNFNIVGSALGAQATPHSLRHRTVYCPRITSSGVGFSTAYWDFRASDREFLHVNEELRLLVRARAGEPVRCRATLRARVVPRGFGRVLRLSGKVGGLDGVCRLA